MYKGHAFSEIGDPLDDYGRITEEMETSPKAPRSARECWPTRIFGNVSIFHIPLIGFGFPTFPFLARYRNCIITNIGTTRRPVSSYFRVEQANVEFKSHAISCFRIWAVRSRMPPNAMRFFEIRHSGIWRRGSATIMVFLTVDLTWVFPIASHYRHPSKTLWID